MQRAWLLLLLSILLFSFNCYSQEDFEIYFTKHNIKAKIDSITSEEFYKNGKPVSWIEPKVNNKIDSILNVMRLRYPASLRDSSKYLALLAKDQTRYLWKDTTSTDPSYWITYTNVNYQNGYLIFYQTYYQGEEYILFNPKTRVLKSVKGFPLFTDENSVYTIGNYMGECYFQYKSLTKDSYLQILSDIWIFTQHYYSKGKFYLEFTDGERKKFLRISFLK